MKFLFWCVGALQCLACIMIAFTVAPAWRWVWICCSVLWFFVGIGVALAGVGKLIAGKVGAGVLRNPSGASQRTPPPHKEE